MPAASPQELNYYQSSSVQEKISRVSPGPEAVVEGCHLSCKLTNDVSPGLEVAGEGCHLSCELTNDVGYVLYSALGSFFIPMLVMLFFYWKVRNF